MDAASVKLPYYYQARLLYDLLPVLWLGTAASSEWIVQAEANSTSPEYWELHLLLWMSAQTDLLCSS